MQPQDVIPTQALSAKRAEIGMPGHGERLARDPILAAVHHDRVARFRSDVTWLRDHGVRFSPFLEIGAGTAQRSLVLHNETGAEGVGVDLNAGSLEDCVVLQRIMGFPNLPLLLVCDAAHLPFQTNSFRFVFAFQMLHRFSNPSPVICEAYRVLGRGGHFYFDEEPVSSPLRQALRGGRTLHSPPTLLESIAGKAHLQKIFWDDAGLDRSHAIDIHRPPFRAWHHALAPFGSSVWIEVNRILRLRFDGQHPLRWAVLEPFASLIGGNIRALCQKQGGAEPTRSIVDRLVCLDCGAGLPALGAAMTCLNCGRSYPVKDGIVRLLPRALETALYGT